MTWWECLFIAWAWLGAWAAHKKIEKLAERVRQLEVTNAE